MILGETETIIREEEREGIQRIYHTPGADIVVWYFADACLLFLQLYDVTKENLRYLRQAAKEIIFRDIKGKYDYRWFAVPTNNPKWIQRMAKGYEPYRLYDSGVNMGLRGHTVLIADISDK